MLFVMGSSVGFAIGSVKHGAGHGVSHPQ
jgi:hypothetical protein